MKYWKWTKYHDDKQIQINQNQNFFHTRWRNEAWEFHMAFNKLIDLNSKFRWTRKIELYPKYLLIEGVCVLVYLLIFIVDVCCVT